MASRMLESIAKLSNILDDTYLYLLELIDCFLCFLPFFMVLVTHSAFELVMFYVSSCK